MKTPRLMTTPSLRRAVVALAITACLSCTLASADTVLVSLPLEPGEGGNGDALPTPSLSQDGRWIAFTSWASNLTDSTPNPNDDEPDVFVRDLLLGSTVRASEPVDGSDFGNASSTSPSLSADGRMLAFASQADNLVPGDFSDGRSDVYVRDLDAGVTTRISLAWDGSVPDRESGSPSLSADGLHVAFTSRAGNLVQGDIQDFHDDIYVHNLASGITSKITPGASDRSQSPAISGDGRMIAFKSRANNLVPGDGNQNDDVFVHDRQTGTTQVASISLEGVTANNASSSPAISADGRFVAFTSFASNLVEDDSNAFDDVFVRDLVAGTTRLISRGHDGSPADQHSYNPCISADGSVIAFHSDAGNLVADDINGDGRDVFVHDSATGTTRLAHRATDGGNGNGITENCGLSDDGSYVAYESTSTNLVDSDPNGALNDIFRSDTGNDWIFGDGFDPGM